MSQRCPFIPFRIAAAEDDGLALLQPVVAEIEKGVLS